MLYVVHRDHDPIKGGDPRHRLTVGMQCAPIAPAGTSLSDQVDNGVSRYDDGRVDSWVSLVKDDFVS
jgi:hypothetical protein